MTRRRDTPTAAASRAKASSPAGGHQRPRDGAPPNDATTNGRTATTNGRTATATTATATTAGDDELPFPLPIGAILGLARLTEHALDEVGLTLPQYRLLGFCAIEPRTPSQVATWLSVRRQSVTRQLDVLVRAGVLERTIDPHDRRRLLHGATPSGQAVLDQGQAVVDDYLALVLATLDGPDRELVHAGLAAAGRALNRAWEITAGTDDDPAAVLRRA